MPVPTYDTMTAFAASLGSEAADVGGAGVHRLEVVHPEPLVAGPFRAGYYSVVLIRSGRGRYWIDGTVHPTRAGTVHFTNPGHVKGFAIDEPVTGYVLTFQDAFLQEHAHASVLDDLPFLLAEAAPPFYADQEPGGATAFAELDALAAQVEAAASRASSARRAVVASLLMVLLLRFREAFWDDYDPVEEGHRGSAIVEAFKRDLEAHVRALVAGEQQAPPSVADLAEAQGLHPNYLSTVIKAKTGRTVGAWTAGRVATEARSMLAGSRVSVKEVAYALGFSEPTAFSRFFKRETGQTPSAFRTAGGLG